MLVNIKINNKEYKEDSSMTILEVAKKHNIKIPTLCYLKREESCLEHKPASCRVCVVQVEGRRNLLPACSTNIFEGLEVHTNSYKVVKERREVVELLLSNHPNDCLTCAKSGNCQLQSLAIDLGIDRISFAGDLSYKSENVQYGSLLKNPSKCILCTRCVSVCSEVQSIGAISASQRGFHTIISNPEKCVNCGQCVQVCPTGALLQVDDTYKIEEAINDPSKHVIVHTAPAVRVSLGEEFGFKPGTDVTGKIVKALRMIGFDKVFDTNFTADLTIMEEATELVQRLTKKENLPLITSCCPGWITFIETQYPSLLNLPSTCKSPQEMFGAVAKTYYAQKMNIDPKDIVVVSLMPCIAKKQELKRDELKLKGLQETDYSMSVKEFARMIKRYGIDFKNLEDDKFDSPLGVSTGAADIFANTGGVIEAASRTAAYWFNNGKVENIEFKEVRGLSKTRSAKVKLDDKTTLRLCVVSGLANARVVLDEIAQGKIKYDAIEIMACPGGCVNGGGQPIHKDVDQIDIIKARQKGIYEVDKNKKVRISCENEGIKTIYKEFFKEPGSHLAHELLHTHYTKKD